MACIPGNGEPGFGQFFLNLILTQRIMLPVGKHIRNLYSVFYKFNLKSFGIADSPRSGSIAMISTVYLGYVVTVTLLFIYFTNGFKLHTMPGGAFFTIPAGIIVLLFVLFVLYRKGEIHDLEKNYENIETRMAVFWLSILFSWPTTILVAIVLADN